MKVTLILATTTTALPGTATFGFRRFTVAGLPSTDTQDSTCAFDLPQGSYSATEQDFAADGSPLGTLQSLSFTVPADTPAPAPAPAATFEAATGLSFTLG